MERVLPSQTASLSSNSIVLEDGKMNMVNILMQMDNLTNSQKMENLHLLKLVFTQMINSMTNTMNSMPLIILMMIKMFKIMQHPKKQEGWKESKKILAFFKNILLKKWLGLPSPIFHLKCLQNLFIQPILLKLMESLISIFS